MAGIAGDSKKVDEKIEECVSVLHFMNERGPEPIEDEWRQKFWQIFPSVCGLVFFIFAWTLMWCSSSTYWLMGSRFTAGVGGGYGFGQVRAYIKDMCEPKLSAVLIKQLNFYGFFGTIVAFSITIFCDFRQFALAALIISSAVLFITLFLPSSPKEFIKANRIEDAVILLNYLRGRKDHTEEIKNVHRALSQKNEYCIVSIMKDTSVYHRIVKFALMIFLQQFSGAPTSFIYCQIIFYKSGCSYPEYCAVLYAIFFFTSNIYSTFYVPRWNKKYTLIFSSISSTIMLILQVLVLYFDINKWWPYTSLFVMLLYISFYCIGVGSLPSTYISEWFPAKYHQGVWNFFTMEFYMCALVATKTFQVLMSSFPFYVGFLLFIVADVFFLIYVLIFIENDLDTRRSYLRSNVSGYLNAKKENTPLSS